MCIFKKKSLTLNHLNLDNTLEAVLTQFVMQGPGINPFGIVRPDFFQFGYLPSLLSTQRLITPCSISVQHDTPENVLPKPRPHQQSN